MSDQTCHCPCEPVKSVMLPITGLGLSVALPEADCLSREEIIQIIREELQGTMDYYLCWYIFKGIHPSPKPGMVPVDGRLIADAATAYPKAFAYLQTEEGQMLCTDEASWQAANHAYWATLADGTQIGWEGIGGICKYVVDLDAETIRVPDLRGMYAEVAGFDSLDVGGVHGDMMRDISGSTDTVAQFSVTDASTPPFSRALRTAANSHGAGNISSWNLRMFFEISGVVPVGNKFAPRAWGALSCVYLGA